MLSSDQQGALTPGGRQPPQEVREQVRGKFLVRGETWLFPCDFQVIIRSRRDLTGGQPVKVPRARPSCGALLSSS